MKRTDKRHLGGDDGSQNVTSITFLRNLRADGRSIFPLSLRDPVAAWRCSKPPPAASSTPRSLASSLEPEEVRVRAMANGQLSAAVSTIKEKGILSGKRIERSEVGTPGEFEALTDDELERALMERMARLGLTDVAETQRDVGETQH
jgi:hypothetical protein